jgi:hypothetical protein
MRIEELCAILTQSSEDCVSNSIYLIEFLVTILKSHHEEDLSSRLIGRPQALSVY